MKIGKEQTAEGICMVELLMLIAPTTSYFLPSTGLSIVRENLLYPAIVCSPSLNVMFLPVPSVLLGQPFRRITEEIVDVVQKGGVEWCRQRKKKAAA